MIYPRDNLMTFDIECFKNYFLISFTHLPTGKEIHIEARGADAKLNEKQRKRIHGLMVKYVSFGYNSNNYDVPMMMLSLQGIDCARLKEASDEIIQTSSPAWMTCRKHDLQTPAKWRTFDIMEPAPAVRISLKLYGGRMHSKRLQDLPYPHDAALTEDEMDHVRDYCSNDKNTNIDLYQDIEERIDLRVAMGEEYHMNFMSKSDAQMAEAIFKHELEQKGVRNFRPPRFDIEQDVMRYKVPDYIRFDNIELIKILYKISEQRFGFDKKGSIALPDWLKKTPIELGGSTYKIGVGGLHSQEKHTHHIPPKGYTLADRDVTSYYPFIILNLGLFPKQLSKKFLDVYESIVSRRLHAKRTGDKITNEGLKISINGSFGKMGSKYSLLYAPEQLLAVTLTGQLALLMLIERLEASGIPVVSANTDGFVSMIPDALYELYDTICMDWELDTGFNLEETRYSALYSRDVNNYLAVGVDGYVKGKGIFAPASVRKNPVAGICVTAVKQYLLHNVPLKDTIYDCTDVRDFITVRSVTGGGVWDGDYLGKCVRWVYSTEGKSIHYMKNANKVATSDGALPLMTLPDSLPATLDYDKYIKMAEKIITEVGVSNAE